MQRRWRICALLLCLLGVRAGCRSTPVAQNTSQPGGSRPPTAPPASAVLLPPNEVGVVPILQYHDISPKERYMGRSAANFRHDLERLYNEDYRPISLHDYLDNRIDLPAGKSPILLTFDDSRKSQFCYRKDGTLDPDCALAILQDFHASHPDFALRAVFFVLPRWAFGQPESATKKLQTLVDMGFEIGNHTVTHRFLRRLSDAEVQKEVATCDAMLKKLVPDVRVEALAFPGGHTPHNRKLIFQGAYGGHAYTYRAGFLAASDPAPSPVAARLDRHRIERVLADENDLGITFWLDYLKLYPEKRYVSDGDPMTVSVPRTLAAQVDEKQLNGATLRFYEAPKQNRTPAVAKQQESQ